MKLINRAKSYEADLEHRRLLDGYMTDAELAAELGVNKRTLDRWQRLGTAPPHIKIGRRRMTHREVAADWLRARHAL